MMPRLFVRSIGLLLFAAPAAALADVTPYPPCPGAKESQSYKVTVNGQPVFVHHFLTYDQFNWMDYASFSMTGKVHVEITNLVSERNLITCSVRPMAYGIHPQISGNKASFDLDRPRYLVVFLNDEPMFHSTGLMLFAEPPEKNPSKLGNANVVNIMDYKVDNTGKTIETATINKAIGDVSARPGGGVLFFPRGIYLSGTVLMKSNVKLYIDVDAVLLGSTKKTDYGTTPSTRGGRPQRAFLVFDHCENAGLAGRGAIDMDGYPWLWHDFQPDTTDGKARDADGKVNDPHGTGIRGYIVSNCKHISFEDLRLLRCAYWTIDVGNTEYFSTRNLKIINRKQQYHDDAYDFRADKHVLIENGFAMTMDDTWALYHGNKPIEDFVVKGFVNYSYTCSLACGYGVAASVKHLRLEDCHFISNHNKFAIWIQLSGAYFTGRGYAPGSRPSKDAPSDDFRFVNCSFENDGGQVYIDGGDFPLTNFAFENCTFYKPNKPNLIMGKKVAPILFKNVKVNGTTVVQSAEELKQAGFDLIALVKCEP